MYIICVYILINKKKKGVGNLIILLYLLKYKIFLITCIGKYSYTPSYSLTLSLLISITHYLSLTIYISLSHSHSLSFSQSLTHSLTLPNSLPLPHSYTRSLSHSLTNSLSLSLLSPSLSIIIYQKVLQVQSTLIL